MEPSTETQAVSAPPGEAQTEDALQRVAINKIEVLSNRLVPGSDGSIEHVVIGNNAVTVIRSTPLKGRVRVSKSNVHVGGVSCKILLTGLEARLNTVRYLVGGDSIVQGALFLSKQRSTPVKRYGSTIVGSPKSVIQELIDQHCKAPANPRIASLTHELDGMFLPFDKLNGSSAA